MVTGYLTTVLLLAGLGVVQPGELLSYRGEISPRGDVVGNEAAGEKAFDLTLLITRADSAGTELHWLVDERGQGSFPWIHRQGSAVVDPGGEVSSGSPPALLFERSGGNAQIMVPLPLIRSGETTAGDSSAQESLSVGHRWERAGRTYEVEALLDFEGNAAARVRVLNNLGRHGELWLSTTEPLALQLTQRVFMGRGEEYQLRLKLVDREQLSAEAAASLTAQFEELTDLRRELGQTERRETVRWNAEQLAELTARLPGLTERIATGPLVAVVREAARDEQLQSRRDTDVQTLRAEMLGQALPELELPALSGGMVPTAELTGTVTILHFWDYRDEPLLPPYGQVGYLDFLHGQRKSQGLQVYGVAVNSRFAEPEQRPSATRSVRKLREFMNLDYPILLDDGRLLKQLGDPRRLGEALPLFVVLDRQGRIAHYQVGLYEVDASQGLSELDQVIAPLLKDARAAAPPASEE